MGKHKPKRDRKGVKGASRAASRTATSREKFTQNRRKRRGQQFTRNA